MRSLQVCLYVLSLGLVSSVFAQSPPKGTQIAVRTIDAIQSKDGEVGQSYRASLDAPITVNGQTLSPKGADAVLRITEMKDAGKLSGKRELILVLSEVRANGNLISLDTEPVTMQSASKGKSTGWKTGLGAAGGAGLGAIIGGGKGAAIGAGAGAATGLGVSALTKGPEIKVPAETVLTFAVR